MVGFPGETDEDFKELCDFVKWAKFDKLGCFSYSKEEGTAAAKMQEQVKANIKKSRYNEIMSIQQKVSNENLKNKIGKVYKALIEDAFAAEDKVVFVGRTYMDVPEIDGNVYVTADEKDLNKVEINNFVNCKITGVKGYDLIAKVEEG
jgi:ribosomal protein S12 methylthiotransferase